MRESPGEFVPKNEVWAALSAPVPSTDISWRQDGKPMQRDGRHFARFVCYIDANTVSTRLDAVVPGEWDLTLDLLPAREIIGDGGKLEPTPDEEKYAFKARLQVLGVIREDVGTGSSFKQASTDAFKRAAVRFGIGRELYNYEQNWVEVDGDSKYAKPVEDPAQAYARRHGQGAPNAAQRNTTAGATTAAATPAAPAAASNGAPRATGSSSSGSSGSSGPITKMPFGKHKGKLLTDVPDDDLRSTVDWCREKGKADLANACAAEIARRKGGNMFDGADANEPPPPDDDDLPF